MKTFYLPRRLQVNGETVQDGDILQQSQLLVILAEPGAGKTDLLAFLADILGVKYQRASIFKGKRAAETHLPALVIDAMDEVARIDQLALNDIIVKAQEECSGTVIFASRSGEWEDARSKYVEECFGKEPLIVRLNAFEADEQKQLFEHWFPSEDFQAFAAETSRFDLTPLMGNPEFLKLFGLAYQQSGRKFTSKAGIYEDAAKRLAIESNAGVPATGRLAADKAIDLAGEVFATILLSGATGVSATERMADRDFPYLGMFDDGESRQLRTIVDSKLFRPSDLSDQHEPVHRIVAEYLAGRYLGRRLGDPTDGLSRRRCLSLIAPNGTVRDELRGMLGWMAALGDAELRRTAIELDPYAVLGNGDPSQLSLPERRLLLDQLQALAREDPFFRRNDSWRSFNVGKFFSADMADGLREILATNENEHLRSLILDLLPGTDAAAPLARDIEQLTLNSNAIEHERLRALHTLQQLSPQTAIAMVGQLLEDGDPSALRLVARIIDDNGVAAVGITQVAGLLRALGGLYGSELRRRDVHHETRYFVKRFLPSLTLAEVTELLDILVPEVVCTCGAPDEWQCHCREGRSKVIGGLLDRYFALSATPHDTERIWRWIAGLKFSQGIGADKSAAVATLSSDHQLRRDIQWLAFAGTDPEGARETESLLMAGYTHSGVRFHEGDYEVLADRAFDVGNVATWMTSYFRHAPERTDLRRPSSLRRKLREQAREKPEFLRAWSLRERHARQWIEDQRRSWMSRNRRFAEREERQKEANLAHLQANRAEIESGRHWGWTKKFAQEYLHRPQEFGADIDRLETAERAVRNGLTAFSDKTPTLTQLANREWTTLAVVLHAGCLMHFREHGNLEGIDRNILAAVKTDAGGYNDETKEEVEAFEAEIDRILFPTLADAESYAREWIEPGLSREPDAATNAEWLRYKKAFGPLQGRLSIEWLRRFPAMPRYAETTLFEIASKHADPDEVKALVAERVKAILSDTGPVPTDPQVAYRRRYWLLNGFLFLDDYTSVWEALRVDPDTVIHIQDRVGRFGHERADLPPFTVEKIHALLDAFVEVWPHVELPNAFGTGDPPGETAYRYLREVAWRINDGAPDAAVPALDALIDDGRFVHYRDDLLAVRSRALRSIALRDFLAPSPQDVLGLLGGKAVATVEDLRALVSEELEALGPRIQRAETNALRTFYADFGAGRHTDENTARDRIVEHLGWRMQALGLAVTVEHHFAGANRCDFTAASVIEGTRRLLTVEVKGQWHEAIFTAADIQLSERYSSHPDAGGQGIYLVLWFGPGELVADRRGHGFANPAQLREAIIDRMPEEIRDLIDVVVIDLSKP